MPFGICSAGEVLQRWDYKTFGDIPDIQIIHDDMIIATENDEDQDEALRTVMELARSKTIKFNPDMIKFKVSEIVYVGHVVSADGLKPDKEKVRAISQMPDPTSKQDLKKQYWV